MTDTLRRPLAEVIAVKRAEFRVYRTAAGDWAVQMTQAPYDVVYSGGTFEDCEAVVADQVADAAIAFFSRWAQEPAQVERVTAAMLPWREAQFPKRTRLSDVADLLPGDALVDAARAAVGALFGEKT